MGVPRPVRRPDGQVSGGAGAVVDGDAGGLDLVPHLDERERHRPETRTPQFERPADELLEPRADGVDLGRRPADGPLGEREPGVGVPDRHRLAVGEPGQGHHLPAVHDVRLTRVHAPVEGDVPGEVVGAVERDGVRPPEHVHRPAPRAVGVPVAHRAQSDRVSALADGHAVADPVVGVAVGGDHPRRQRQVGRLAVGRRDVARRTGRPRRGRRRGDPTDPGAGDAQRTQCRPACRPAPPGLVPCVLHRR